MYIFEFHFASRQGNLSVLYGLVVYTSSFACDLLSALLQGFSRNSSRYQ